LTAARFRSQLSANLSHTFRLMQSINADARVKPMLTAISKHCLAPVYKAAFTGRVTPDQLPMLSKRSFPVCMSHLYESLVSESHLRHGGRMQLGLFLKGIGLQLDDALAFWRQAMSRRLPPEKFNREYAYNIRHNYGKEGKRASYTPYGCTKIIMSQPSGIAHHYQLACRKVYAYTHGGQVPDNVGNHPNAYFEASAAHHKQPAPAAAGAAAASTPPAVPASAAAAMPPVKPDPGGAADMVVTPPSTPSSAAGTTTTPPSDPERPAPMSVERTS